MDANAREYDNFQRISSIKRIKWNIIIGNASSFSPFAVPHHLQRCTLSAPQWIHHFEVAMGITGFCNYEYSIFHRRSHSPAHFVGTLREFFPPFEPPIPASTTLCSSTKNLVLFS